MRVGTDTSKLPGVAEAGALRTLDRIAAMGLDGAFFRSVFDLSPTVDRGEIAEVAAHARSLGLYLEVGAGKINPFATPETPAARSLGGGDFLAAMTHIVQVLAEAGVHELWTATANYQFRFDGLRACDRFRTDVDWADQLQAKAKVMRGLAPVHEGNRRLHARWVRFIERNKRNTIADVAIARELAGWCWSLAVLE